MSPMRRFAAALAVAVHETDRTVVVRANHVGPRVVVGAVANHLAETVDVERGDALRVGQLLRHNNRDAHLLDRQIRVGRNDRSTAELHALAAQVASEAALLALQSLHERALGRGGLHQRGHAGQVAVDQLGTEDLEVVPVVHHDAHVRAVGDGGLQLRVGPRDVLQDHRDVVLVAAVGAFHLHGRADGHGRHDDVGQDEVLGTTRLLVDPNQREVLGGNALEEVQHHLRREVFLRLMATRMITQALSM